MLKTLTAACTALCAGPAMSETLVCDIYEACENGNCARVFGPPAQVRLTAAVFGQDRPGYVAESLAASDRSYLVFRDAAQAQAHLDTRPDDLPEAFSGVILPADRISGRPDFEIASVSRRSDLNYSILDPRTRVVCRQEER
ncbi:hypothetical protein FIU94_14350 [Sulfitobacter sp. THAF37]|uniref:hypothetical protein n=1 Tax=Sulfitobacter sp. THAF37 TaxID=2587855 RepID=UPI0012687736|nr:hypothetical protein [Sulfitobacter sp. THAF37]QFT60009.1 hypothetical protein FIU94_14350 [Sulfitobacter sp. THAF37]